MMGWPRWLSIPDAIKLDRKRRVGDSRTRAAITRWHSWDATAVTGEDEPQALRPGDGVVALGREFVWTAQHLRRRDLDKWRQRGDEAADLAIQQAAGLRRASGVLTSLHQAVSVNKNVIPDVTDATAAAAIMPLWAACGQLPDWVEPDRIDRGCTFFVKYLPAAGVSLFYLGLVGGFSAPLITEVLNCTGYLTSPGIATTRRILETLQMISTCVLSGAEGFRAGGDAHVAVLRVRLLHAQVRNRILRERNCAASDASPPGCKQRWDSQKYGVPINQEDMAVTLLAFSINVLTGIELALGWDLPSNEKLDYIHLWRLIGWLIGIEDRFNPCSKDLSHCDIMLDSILMHILKPNKLSQRVALNLLQSPLANGRMPDVDVRREVARQYLGEEWSSALLSKSQPSFWVKCKAAIHCWIIRLYTIATTLPLLGWIIFMINRRILQMVHSAMTRMNPEFDVKSDVDIAAFKKHHTLRQSSDYSISSACEVDTKTL